MKARIPLARWLVLLAALGLALRTFSQTADSFNPDPTGESGVCVGALAVQADSQILLGGLFTSLAAQPYARLARVGPDGSPDTTFAPAPSSSVTSLAIQPDGRILVAGGFLPLCGQSCPGLGRLNADGSLDTTFSPSVGQPVYSAGLNCLAVQADGKILVGGSFTNLDGQTCFCLGRLNPDGTRDASFTSPFSAASGLEPSVTCLALQTNGQILVGGAFTTLGGVARNCLARVSTNGAPDHLFNPAPSAPFNSGLVNCLAVQPDGQVLIGGGFTSLGGQSCAYLGRVTATGGLDTSFQAALNGQVWSLALQADGRILVAGSFTSVGGLIRTNIARVNADGSVDTTFNVADKISSQPFLLRQSVDALALQTDGSTLVGGTFTYMGGQTRVNLARLTNAPATQSLGYAGTTVTWSRGGAAPEIWRATFDYSTNSVAWLSLGPATRVAGGWQLSPVSLPANAALRARGFVAEGYYSASSWFVETLTGPPILTRQPVGRTNNANTTASFRVGAEGSAPLGFQWCKDGVSLSNGPLVAGSQTATLTLSNVFGPQDGSYSLVVSNAFGAVTSQAARLTVVEPIITMQPATARTDAGQPISLSVSVLASPKPAYQWRKNGVNLPALGGPSLSFPSPQGSDAAGYDVIVSNAFGCVTSSAATLTVNCATVDRWDPTNSGTDPETLVIQPDARLVVGCQYANSANQNPSRFMPDGSTDLAFEPAADSEVAALALQPDGKLLVGGYFENLGGQPCHYLGRLNPDGSLDTAFCPGGAGGDVLALALQADNRILVGGYFSALNGQACQYLGRLNPDGTLDNSLVSGADAAVYALAVQPDGKILVGGDFSSLLGQSCPYLGRLNPDGSLDTGFAVWLVNGPVYSLVLQPDGKVLVGGSFTGLWGQSCSGIGRLNSDGSLDASFYTGPSSGGSVYFIALQTDGRIVVAGAFNMLVGLPRTCLGRLNPDGSTDLTFDPYPSAVVYSLALQPDGAIVVAGGFTSLGPLRRLGLGRLVNTDPATQSLTLGPSSVTWLRSGTSPEVWSTTFDLSTNGLDWLSLGPGVRIPGGWQLTSVSLPTFSIVRARGFVAAGGGAPGSSSYFVESRVPPLAVIPNDSSFGFSSGSFGFNLAGPQGQTAVIEATTDFLNWSPLATNSFGAGPFYFSDTNSAAFPWRFYRARLQ